MVRGVVSLVCLLWAATAIGQSNDCARRYPSPDVEARVQAAASRAWVSRDLDPLTVLACGSRKRTTVQIDTHHELQPDGAEMWNRLFCEGDVRPGKEWRCSQEELRGTRIDPGGSDRRVQIVFPSNWFLVDARKAAFEVFDAYRHLTAADVCPESARMRLRFEDLKRMWSETFASYELSGSVGDAQLAVGWYFVRARSGQACWGKIEVSVTS